MFKRVVATLVIALGLAATVATAAVPVAALDVACQSSNAGQCNLVKSNQKLDNQVWRILQVVFGMIVFGGFMYTTSAGDAGKVKNAKNTILYAIVGLIVAVFATAIVSFVLASIS